jgi:hypothetical protein
MMGLSRLVLDFPKISEVDINPLIIDSEGIPRAVDALIIKRKGE